jgi:hypothetical protein
MTNVSAPPVIGDLIARRQRLETGCAVGRHEALSCDTTHN